MHTKALGSHMDNVAAHLNFIVHMHNVIAHIGFHSTYVIENGTFDCCSREVEFCNSFDGV